jgi:cytochrome c2
MLLNLTYMTSRLRLVATTLAIFTISIVATAQDDGIPTEADVIASGATLFKNNCKQCHQVHKDAVGPMLKDVQTRRSVEWLVPWVQNSSKVIASGDAYAVALYEKWGKAQMQSFNLNRDEILSILAYVKDESAKTPDVVVAGGGGETQAGGSGVDSGYITAVLVILVVVLVLLLVILGLIVSVLTKYLKDKKDLEEEDVEIVHQRLDFQAFFTSNGFLGLVVFIFTAVALKTLIDGAFSIGIQQGYQPTQPIAFSHKIHAGQFEIDCNYCHTGVRKGKSANIPSPNICMNCHGEIKKESAEIAKIYAALDYNPTTREYGPNQKPIEWVRIHNLPDLAYFNHQQHVAVAGLECQTCHGPIEEMDVVYQYSNLTMGWCINCHRETDVKTDNNGYYKKLVELHKSKSKEPMKVEDIGGLECSKCHY